MKYSELKFSCFALALRRVLEFRPSPCLGSAKQKLFCFALALCRVLGFRPSPCLGSAKQKLFYFALALCRVVEDEVVVDDIDDDRLVGMNLALEELA